MADLKITQLNELAATPTSGDLLTIIDDPGGAGVESKKITVDNLVAFQDLRSTTYQNKSISLTTNTITGTTAEFNAALTDDDFATQTNPVVLSNKQISLGSNTITGTTAQFNTALTDDDFATLTNSVVLQNKTINSSNNTITLNLTTGTLTGTTAQFNTALSDNDFATLTGTETLQNKTLEATLLNGTLSANDQIVDQPRLQDYSETVNALTNVSGTTSINYELGNVVTVTFAGPTTFTFDNPPSNGIAGSFTLIMTDPTTNPTFPTSVDWAGGTEPTWTTTGVDIVTFMTTNGGTTWYGFAAGLDMK